jgi:hypothetical protein
MISGGYPQSIFVAGNPPAVLNCSICMQVARNPHRCEQEHVFCLDCISTWLRDHHTCPMDRSKLCRHNLSVFRLAQDMLNDLQIRCPNVSAEDAAPAAAAGKEQDLSPHVSSSLGACTWVGRVQEERAHSDVCPYARVRCTWKECALIFRRCDLAAHVLTHCLQNCVDCQEEYEKDKAHLHRKSCKKRRVPCSNGCGEEDIVFDAYEEHKASCPYEEVQCPHHSSVGCTFKTKRNAMRNHANDIQAHFMPMMAALGESRAQVNALTASQTLMRIELEVHKLLLSDQEDKYTSGYFFWRIGSPSIPNMSLVNQRSGPCKIGAHTFTLLLRADPAAQSPTATDPTGLGIFICLESGSHLPTGRSCKVKAKVRVNKLNARLGSKVLIRECHVIMGEIRPPHFNIGRNYDSAHPDFIPSLSELKRALDGNDLLEFEVYIRYEIG